MIQLKQLGEGVNHFHYEAPKDGWLKSFVHQLRAKGYPVEGFQVDLDLIKTNPDYHLQGKLKFTISLACARCAEPFASPLTHLFQLVLVRGAIHRQEASPDAIEQLDEADVFALSGDDLDPSSIVEEQFYLSLPIKALCKNDCKGICQQCGKNMNLGPCACKSPMEVSPFSVLKKLKS